MAVTLKEIAKQADVSVATVSFALRGRKDGRGSFPPETVSDVREIADQLKYHPNASVKISTNNTVILKCAFI